MNEDFKEFLAERARQKYGPMKVSEIFLGTMVISGIVFWGWIFSKLLERFFS